MKKRNKVTISIIIFSFVSSLLVNFTLLFSPLPTQKKVALVKRKKPTRLKVKLVIPKKAEKNEKKKQIVNTEKKKEEKPPEKSKFLGKVNQTFKKETKASKVGAFKKGSKAIRATKNKRKKSRKKQVKKKRKLRLIDLAIRQPSLLKEKNELKIVDKKGDEKEIGVSQNNDFLEEIPLGDMTNLNTTEYRFYGFFQRIRQKLEQHWGRSLREKAKTLFKSGRSLGRREHKITSLTVTINQLGQIVEVVLKSKSGVKELDDAAIESFNKAGPFPNPPKGFIKNGRAKIEWGFVVKS